MNNVVLIGRLTMDPELIVLQTGREMTKFNLAVDRMIASTKKKEYEEEGKPTADFPRIVAWGSLAKLCYDYLNKGRLVGIIGEVTTYRLISEEGLVTYHTDITARQIKFLEKMGEETQSKEASDIWTHVEM